MKIDRTAAKNDRSAARIDRTAVGKSTALRSESTALRCAPHCLRSPKLAQSAARLQPSAAMPPTGSKRTRTEAVAVPKGDQIIAAWLTGVLEPRTNVAAAQRLAYPTETVFSAPYVTHIAVRIE